MYTTQGLLPLLVLRMPSYLGNTLKNREKCINKCKINAGKSQKKTPKVSINIFNYYISFGHQFSTIHLNISIIPQKKRKNNPDKFINNSTHIWIWMYAG